MKHLCLAALLTTAALPLGATAAHATAPAAALSAQRDGVEVTAGALKMRLTALADGLVRVRIARDGAYPEDASWAVLPEQRKARAKVTPTADGFTTASLRVRIGAGGAITFETLDGKIISADAAPVAIDGKSFTLRKSLPITEHFYGLGDKTGGLDRRGKEFVDWNTDAFGFTSADDPIYKSIPFFLSTGAPGGSYGILLDNTYRTWFDFGHRDADTLTFGGPDGPIDYYFVAGPSLADVTRRYADLTGHAPLAPKWALGYQQSRYSYMSADEIREIARHLRADRVPTDVIWMDIDYQDRNRPFTTNPKTFPDLPKLAADMKAQGIKLVAITDLHIAKVETGYAPYTSGKQGDEFVKNPDGTDYVAPVWPGASVFPDFTQTKSRAWWGTLYKGFLEDGIAGFWNDMNEPAIFNTPTKTMPLDTVHRIASDDFAPRTGDHREIHNVYGMQNTRATYDGLLTLRPDERPFVMTRASYAGGQRYAVTWTGDNSATWDHLKLSVQQIINLGLSGFAYSAADVSGFAGGPSPDLLTRWFEIGAFTPVFRDHSATGTPRVEPWVDGPDHLAIRRRFVEERYRLMPYFYALADQNSRLGDPIMRPVFYDYPSAASMGCNQSMAFTLGKALLIAPPPSPESPQTYDVCLPAGGWYDYWTGLRAGTPEAATSGPIQSATQAVPTEHAKSERVLETPRLDRLPVFVRAGTILPRQPLVQSTAQTPSGPLMLDIYPGGDCSGTLYEDDGTTLGYQRGAFFRQTVRCATTATGITVTFDSKEGSLAPWWKQIAVTVHGWQGPGRVTQNGASLNAESDVSAQTLRFTIPTPGKAARVTIEKN
ncbi:alpha-glucosidase [Sphingomonas sp. BE270]|jgi:alpha-glucosidase|uniref:TIM-barrel domain-containing protein n=1 Tax=unclassified Sphingomonas TaxID=196159 RepID=UPI00053D2DF4|nr:MULTISPECIES: TIM-barrel domain-containing protein [unclassified Sphingomonas]MDR6847776.1 alpha-glucosidase [Sphingomonas sp. BE137]MDR7259180.1 alpha-glucosidase [Sphingomonas sp. BE270]